MKRVLKIIAGILLCVVGLFFGMAFWASPEKNAAVYFILVLALAFLIPGILLLVQAAKGGQQMHQQGDAYYNARIAEADAYYNQKMRDAFQQKNNLLADIENLKAQLAVMQHDSISEAVNIEAYENLRSDEVKNQLSMLKLRQDEAVKNGTAVTVLGITSSTKGYKSNVNPKIKQILRCFNVESASIIQAVTVKNADSSRGKLTKSFETLNRLFQSEDVQLSQEYLSLKLEELSLVYAYMVKLEEEKEQRRAAREQMLEEEKVRKEIERQKQKIEKEETQFSNEMNKLMVYMQKSKEDVERQVCIDEINSLQAKLDALQKDKSNVLQREQNTRAGFVYIISNIGSFGENVYKIGMTRRLEPMDRIAELSSASVPFPFDVHAMIFSDDAPRLENVLHQYFEQKRVNRVNTRKEFFRVDLEEIKKVVLENHNATVKFIDIPDAAEYRETLQKEAGGTP